MRCRRGATDLRAGSWDGDVLPAEPGAHEGALVSGGAVGVVRRGEDEGRGTQSPRRVVPRLDLDRDTASRGQQVARKDVSKPPRQCCQADVPSPRTTTISGSTKFTRPATPRPSTSPASARTATAAASPASARRCRSARVPRGPDGLGAACRAHQAPSLADVRPPGSRCCRTRRSARPRTSGGGPALRLRRAEPRNSVPPVISPAPTPRPIDTTTKSRNSRPGRRLGDRDRADVVLEQHRHLDRVAQLLGRAPAGTSRASARRPCPRPGRGPSRGQRRRRRAAGPRRRGARGRPGR